MVKKDDRGQNWLPAKQGESERRTAFMTRAYVEIEVGGCVYWTLRTMVQVRSRVGDTIAARHHAHKKNKAKTIDNRCLISVPRMFGRWAVDDWSECKDKRWYHQTAAHDLTTGLQYKPVSFMNTIPERSRIVSH